MNDYLVGDKFVVEIEEICECTERNVYAEPHTLYRAKGFNTLVFDENGLGRLERLDGDYVNENFGELQNEAYEAGKNDGRDEVLNWQKGNEEDAYNKGLEDAWELAKKIAEKLQADRLEIFNLAYSTEIFQRLTPREALAKFEAYEKSKEEIKVGDVVEINGDMAVVTSFGTDGDVIHVIYFDGIVNSYRKDKPIKKTGKHIDISAILAEIRKE